MSLTTNANGGSLSYDSACVTDCNWGSVTSGYVGMSASIRTRIETNDDRSRVIKFLLPKVDRDDIKVTVNKKERMLRISIDEEGLEDNEFVDHFNEDILLSEEYDLNKIGVMFGYDVLTIAIAKHDEYIPKELEIEATRN